MKPLLAVLPLVVVLGCRSEVADPAPAPAAAPSATPHAALDALDARKPVPLLPRMALHQKQNMRDHLVAVQEIVLALAKDDFEAAGEAARLIGFSEHMG